MSHLDPHLDPFDLTDCHYCDDDLWTTTTSYGSDLNDTLLRNTTDSDWEWPSLLTITLTSTLLGLVILVTIVGNVFVIAAVFVEKNLQNSVANYLIVSLAVADLMVACLVMPLGALYEIAGNQWILGAVLCDMWTSSDVLACTASILHLVAIAVDRYWAVTDIEYIRSRNKTRIFTMILLVWLVAVIVSLAPILGWKDPHFYSRVEQEKRCQISQDIGYQIFATCATFYVPLFVILLLYWKIFQTARRRIRRRPGRLGIDKFKQVILSDEGSSRATEGQVSNQGNTPPTHLQTPVTGALSRETTADLSTNPSPTDLTPIDHKKSDTIESLLENTEERRNSSDIERDDSTAEMGENEGGNNFKTLDLNGRLAEEGSERPAVIALATLPATSYLCPPSTLNLPTGGGVTTPTGNTLTLPFTITPNSATVTMQQRKRNKESIEAKRERKAAKTLAIITGAFVVCWLPFFVMALTLAVCFSCFLPAKVESAFLWLGYFNSTLNPIIYTLFSPEFRQAFKRILCGRNRSRRRRK